MIKKNVNNTLRANIQLHGYNKSCYFHFKIIIEENIYLK